LQILRRVRNAILERVLSFENMVDCGHIAHVDVIFHLRVHLRNMISICLLSLTFRKNESENVVEYGSRRKSTLKKI